MSACIICRRIDITFNKPEHIIPQALIKNNLTLKGVVRDLCNERFGKTLDAELTNNRTVKAKFQGNAPPINFIETKKYSRDDVMGMIGQIMKNENRTAYRKGKHNSTVFLLADDQSNTGKFALAKGNLEVKHPEIYLFALAKISVEYLYYTADIMRISVRQDPVFCQICIALHEYTKSKKVTLMRANEKATKIWPISNAGVNHSYAMPFNRNGIWHTMNVEKYIQWASNDKREHILYWLQVLNIQGYVGVLIVLGRIPPMIAIAGSERLA